MGTKLSPAADVFVLNSENKVLLVKRTDNGFWCLPGGRQDLGETPAECAARECFEESGYKVKITGIIGVYSSQCYEYTNYPWKDNEFCHVCYRAEVIGGEPTLSHETSEIGWFAEGEIPPLSDGHDIRIKHGFKMRKENLNAYFE